MEISQKENGEKWCAKDVIELAKGGDALLVHQDLNFLHSIGISDGSWKITFTFRIGVIPAKAQSEEVAILAILRCFSWVFVSTVRSCNARCQGEQMSILISRSI
jgi:hypothetical protein